MDAMFIDTNGAAKRFGIPKRTLMLWREKRRGPDYFRLGGKVFYKVEELKIYFEAGRVRSDGPV